MKKQFLTILFLLLIILHINADGIKSNFSFNIEYMGSSTPVGLNVECSPNEHLDFGLGFQASLRPLAEIHLYSRYSFLDYFISPFIQISGTFIYPGQINENPEWFLGRAEAGAKINFNEDWFMGIGGGYQFIGSEDVLVPTQYNRFYPTLFVGWSPF